MLLIGLQFNPIIRNLKEGQIFASDNHVFIQPKFHIIDSSNFFFTVFFFYTQMFFSFHFLFRRAAIVLVLFFSACVYVSVRDGEKDIWHMISWVPERKRLCVFFFHHTPPLPN